MGRRLLVLPALVAIAAALLCGCKRYKPPPVKAVWIGPAGGYAALASDKLVAWGGRAGDGASAGRPIASGIDFGKGKPTTIAIGGGHACAVFDGRTAACWGSGTHGELGSPLPSSPTPVVVPTTEMDNDGPIRIATGAAHTCVWSDHHLRCFGSDTEGQIGRFASSGASASPERILAVALGEAHTCVARVDESGATKPARAVHCAGRPAAAPAQPVLADLEVKLLVAGGAHTCATIADGSLRCWGRNDAGQLGDGTTTDSLTPAEVHEIRGVRSLALGARHTCVAQTTTRTIACWGDNRHHQLATGTVTPSARPVLIPGVFAIVQVAAAGDASCAVLGEGELRCWGANEQGQLGDGTTVEHDVPMPVKFAADARR